MPAAVGVALGKPGTRVIGVIGDGSSLYSIQAVWSAAQLSLPITFVILNNGRYAALAGFCFGFWIWVAGARSGHRPAGPRLRGDRKGNGLSLGPRPRLPNVAWCYGRGLRSQTGRC